MIDKVKKMRAAVYTKYDSPDVLEVIEKAKNKTNLSW